MLRADRPRAGFLVAVTLAAGAYVALLFTMHHPWREVCVLLTLVGVIIIIPVLRAVRRHWEYRMAQLQGRAPSGVAYTLGWPQKGRGQDVIHPVIINQTPGGRFVL